MSFLSRHGAELRRYHAGSFLVGSNENVSLGSWGTDTAERQEEEKKRKCNRFPCPFKKQNGSGETTLVREERGKASKKNAARFSCDDLFIMPEIMGKVKQLKNARL